MSDPNEVPKKEASRLQGYLNDLVSLLALPALWAGGDGRSVLGTMLEVLLGVLRLDFAYAYADGSPPMELVRMAERRHEPRETSLAFGPWLHPDERPPMQGVPNPVGEGTVSLARAPLATGGMIVVGSTRADFPTVVENLILQVAVNQAVIELQQAELAAARARGPTTGNDGGHTAATFEEAAREHILKALSESRWVIGGAAGAAARLGLKRTSLQYKMQKLGIVRPPK